MLALRAKRYLSNLAVVILAGALALSGCKKITPPPDANVPPALGILYTLDTQGVQESWKRIKAHDPETVRLLGSLHTAADKAILHQITSVTDKPAQQRPAGGGAHDYYSLSDYHWPNPTKPNAKYERHEEWPKNPEVDTIRDKANIRAMFDDVIVLSLATYLGGNKKYAQRAAEHLRAWFVTPGTRMNPHLKYAQMIKNNPEVPEGQGIIDVYDLPEVLDAITLMVPLGVLSADDLQELKKWFGAYYSWLQSSGHGQKEAAYTNNRGTWYRAQLVALSHYLGMPEVAKNVASEWKTLVAKQIQPDGSQPEELNRGTSWNYSTFNLLALFRFGLAARAVGIKTFSDDTLLPQAARFLLPFGTGAATWHYPQVDKFEPKLLGPPLAYAASIYEDQEFTVASKKFTETPASIRLAFLLPPQPSTSPTVR